MASPTDTNDMNSASAFVITREFDAPRSLVFQAWTDSEHLARWFGPKGSTMLTCELDLRPGGRLRYSMSSPNGMVMWGQWVFREIAPPERLVFVFSFTDEDGNITRHPFAPTWPLEVLSTLTLQEQDGRTTLTLHGIPIHATEAERQTYEAGRDSMRGGWTGTLDQLEAHLAEAKQS